MAARGLSLSSTQVAASVLATLTGAAAASYLGVGGTLAGAAVGSIASTAGTEVYRHYLGRTHERLRGAMVTRRYRAVRRTVVSKTDPGAAQNRIGVTSRRRVSGSDAAETEILYMQHRGDGAHPAGAGQNPTTSLNDPVHDSPTEVFAAADSRSQGLSAGIPVASGKGAEGNGTEGSGGQGRRPRWLRLAGIVAGTFLVAVAVITVFELSVGKPLDALIWHRHGGGTTVGGVIGGQRTKTTPAPTATPSVQPTTSGAPVTPAPPPTSVGATPSSSATQNPGGPAATPTP